MMEFNTDEFFSPGKLSVVLDAQAGSSGKGKIGSFLFEHSQRPTFAANAFSAQAGHWVRPDQDRKFFYQTFNSCAYLHDRYEALYIGPDAVIEVPAFWREVEENKIPHDKIKLHPLAAVIQPGDQRYERGEEDFEHVLSLRPGTKTHGSTCHGVGAARARRLLRRSDTLLARDVPSLAEFLDDTTSSIHGRLEKGESGLLEVAQGFQLSLLGQFYPNVTSRNVSVAAAFDGLMVSPRFCGNVCLNLRTYPIRISSSKFLSSGGKHLTWTEVQDHRAAGLPVTEEKGNSGGWYPDQAECSWEDVTRWSGSREPIFEMTSVTKLPRRVATFSVQNLKDAIRVNRAPDGFKTFLSVNFLNYVDAELYGRRAVVDSVEAKFHQRMDKHFLPHVGTCPVESIPEVSERVSRWLDSHVRPVIRGGVSPVVLRWLGTGPLTDDCILVQSWAGSF